MTMWSVNVAGLVAAGVLAAMLPAPVAACCKPPDQMAKDQQIKAATEARPPGSASGGSSGSVTAEPDRPNDLQAYIGTRRQIAQRDPDLERVLESERGAIDESRLHAALADAGSPLLVEDFLSLHRLVLNNPDLTAQINQQVQAQTGRAVSSTR
jgi:hypothetical protein